MTRVPLLLALVLVLEPSLAQGATFVRSLAHARSRIVRFENWVLDRVEPKNRSGFKPPYPTSGRARRLNLVEATLSRMKLLRPVLTSADPVSERLIRGTAQDEAGFAALQRKYGIKTVINLQRESDGRRSFLEQRGIRAIDIPVYDAWVPSVDEVKAFLRIAEDPSQGPIYVHCRRGIGRTGIMVAAYRIHHDGFTAEQAIAEAQRHGMNSEEQIGFIRQLGRAL